MDDIEVDEEVKALGDIPDVDTDLDAIMGSAFDEGSEVASSIDSEDDLETEMPSRAAQQRATEIPGRGVWDLKANPVKTPTRACFSTTKGCELMFSAGCRG